MIDVFQYVEWEVGLILGSAPLPDCKSAGER